jgi:hypothetical protein
MKIISGSFWTNNNESSGVFRVHSSFHCTLAADYYRLLTIKLEVQLQEEASLSV